MAPANPAELKLALLALFSVVGAVPPHICGRTLDDATLAAGEIPAGMVDEDAPARIARARLGAARILNSLCAACGACERSVTGETVGVMAPPPR